MVHYYCCVDCENLFGSALVVEFGSSPSAGDTAVLPDLFNSAQFTIHVLAARIHIDAA